jgi:oligopeptide transport system ATP-binding protein
VDAPGALCEVRDLRVHFTVKKGLMFKRAIAAVRAVDGVSFAIREGETLGLVGESGCGKTTTARALARLERPTSGEIFFAGKDLCQVSREELLRIRMDLQMIFQDPYASLNPRMKVRDIVAEPMQIYVQRGLLDMSRREIRKRVGELMDRVGISRIFMDRYPHEFSGGQRQRIGIARALALNPRMIIADEPVSALDVSIRSQIINLLVDLQESFGLTYLFISHDLAVVKYISSRIAVMYLGTIVEMAKAADLCTAPLHPYTRALLSASPVPDPRIEHERKRILLKGDVLSLDQEKQGCYFYARCPTPQEHCRMNVPPLVSVQGDHQAACFLYAKS